jgi:hypothetical protein
MPPACKKLAQGIARPSAAAPCDVLGGVAVGSSSRRRLVLRGRRSLMAASVLTAMMLISVGGQLYNMQNGDLQRHLPTTIVYDAAQAQTPEDFRAAKNMSILDNDDDDNNDELTVRKPSSFSAEEAVASPSAVNKGHAFKKVGNPSTVNAVSQNSKKKAHEATIQTPPSGTRNNINPEPSIGNNSGTQSSHNGSQSHNSSQSGVHSTNKNAVSQNGKPLLPVIYTKARLDRSGSAISHMLASHAWAYHRNQTYGGACFRPDQVGKALRDKFAKHQHDQRRLLDGLGLSQILPFSCSDNPETIPYIPQHDLDREHHAKLWTPDWLTYIRSHFSYPPKDPSIFDMVVHVRRQDINPCGIWAHRYLTNQYFLQQIRNYWPNTDKQVCVTVHSTKSNPFEPFTDFSNYSVALDADVVETWRNMMTADVFITSISGFSLIPALMNPNGIIVLAEGDSYSNFSLPHWERASVEARFNCTT